MTTFVGSAASGTNTFEVMIWLGLYGIGSPLSDELEVCAYRVVQESLTNVVRHASATTVHVHLAYDEHALSIAVEDDGVGGPAQPGAGLEGMRERVAIAPLHRVQGVDLTGREDEYLRIRAAMAFLEGDARPITSLDALRIRDGQIALDPRAHAHRPAVPAGGSPRSVAGLMRRGRGI